MWLYFFPQTDASADIPVVNCPDPPGQYNALYLFFLSALCRYPLIKIYFTSIYCYRFAIIICRAHIFQRINPCKMATIRIAILRIKNFFVLSKVDIVSACRLQSLI